MISTEIQKFRWLDLIEISMQELVELILREQANSPSSHPKSGCSFDPWFLYAEAMRATFLREKIEIPRLIVSSKTCEANLIKVFVRIRSLFLRCKSGDPTKLIHRISRIRMIFDRALSSTDESFVQNLLVAEASFLLSDLLHDAEDFEQADALTRLAICHYQKIGAHRKALRSQMNLSVTRANLCPDRSYLAEFLSHLQRAKQLQDLVSMSNAYHCISHEYECIGALRNSLRAIDRAIALSFKYHFSSKLGDYFAHKIDLLVKLNDRAEAQTCFELLLSVKSSVGERAVDYLLSRHSFLSTQAAISKPAELPASYWKDKLEPNETLGALEERLLSLLSKKHRTRIELAEALYGESLPIQSTEARTKNLLFRIRKRYPNLIYFKNGYYGLSRETNVRTIA